MDKEADNRIRLLEDALRQSVNAEYELREMLSDAMRRIDELEGVVEKSLAENGSSSVSDDAEGVDYAPPRVMGVDPGFFVSPDEVATDQEQSNANKRKSLSLMPETDGGLQLHEFDNAPSQGTIHLVASMSSCGTTGSAGDGAGTGSSSGSSTSVTLKLVDPDGHTADEDSSQKWMVPLRQADGDGKVLHWARIGNSVTFDVGSIVDAPCPPVITASIITSGDDKFVRFCVQNRKRENGYCVDDGDPECTDVPLERFRLDCDDVLACASSGWVVTDTYISGTSMCVKKQKVWMLKWGEEEIECTAGETCDGDGGTDGGETGGEAEGGSS